MRQLPGISFETIPPLLAETLPRVDIAAFVGFAQSGPLDLPVAVEDGAQFRELFGEDVALAWDDERNRVQYGLLGPTVESFFDNGGSRCFVVRVARDPVWHRFALPNLLAVGDELPHEAEVRARSPGAWAQTFRVGTTLQPAAVAPLPTLAAQPNPDIQLDSGGAMLGVQVDLAAPPGNLMNGDLLELSFLPSNLLLFMVISRVELIDRGLRVTASAVFGETRWQWANNAAGSAEPEPQRSPRLDLLKEKEGINAYTAWVGSLPSSRALRIRRLSFEINVWRDGRLESRIGNLSFCPKHPRFFGLLPSDEVLFADFRQTRPDGRDAEYDALRREASGERARMGGGQRFPLAGIEDTLLGRNWPLYLPNGMGFTRTPTNTAEALTQASDDVLAQDGLADFVPGLFFDERLQDYSGDSLLRSAEQMQNLAREWEYRPQGLSPQRQRGLHALRSVQQATLLAVPDATPRPRSTDQPPSAKA